MSAFQDSREFAEGLDSADELVSFRRLFHLPKTVSGEDCVYLCGHSLGLQPRSAGTSISQVLADWAKLGVSGHFRGDHPWLEYPRSLAEQGARLVGGQPSEVAVMNSLTVNLHLMMVSFYRPTPARHRIIIEKNAFPSDRYAVQSQIAFHGFDPADSLVEVSSEEEMYAILEDRGESISLILIGGVNYLSGRVFDMQGIATAAHAHGCIAGFDLAHAAGNIPLHLHAWDVDFAVWCTYKYLNGGPGSVAGCFVHERYGLDPGIPRFAGWWGNRQETRFQMGPGFEAAPGAAGWQVSNPPILALAALRASLDLFEEAGMDRLRAKSVRLTGYLEFLLSGCRGQKFSILTPSDPGQRGAQLSIRVPSGAHTAAERLEAEGIVCDCREPDILRVAPVPLYNSFLDVYRFVKAFARIAG
ncbi:MAG: kynureninase [Bryobacteraceae bacterium]